MLFSIIFILWCVYLHNMDIIKATKKDFPGVFMLLEQLWPGKRLNKERLRKVFNKGLKSQEFLIAKDKGRIMGFVSLIVKNSLSTGGNLGYISELIVDKPFRQKGVGSRLVDEISKIAKKRGCRKVELDSAFRRKKAHEFYKSKGFDNRGYLFSKGL